MSSQRHGCLRDVGRCVYYYNNHPIRFVRLTGLIVAVDEFAQRRVYTLDDSSGSCIECICPVPSQSLPSTSNSNAAPNNAPNSKSNTKVEPATKTKPAPTQPSTAEPWIPWDDMDVGTVVKIKGKPSQFRDIKQVEIVKAEVIRGTEIEVRCWGEVGAFRREVLEVPWVVSKEQEEKLRKRATSGRGKEADRRKRESEKKAKEEKRKKQEVKERQEEEKRDKEGKKAKERQDEEKDKREREIERQEERESRKRFAEQAKGRYDALGI